MFNKGVLKKGQRLKFDDPTIESLADEWIEDVAELDRVFVYQLLAVKGVCVVPLSSFHSELKGFRVTLLEEDEELLIQTFEQIRDSPKILGIAFWGNVVEQTSIILALFNAKLS